MECLYQLVFHMGATEKCRKCHFFMIIQKLYFCSGGIKSHSQNVVISHVFKWI